MSVVPYLAVGFPFLEEQKIIFWLNFGGIFVGAFARACTVKLHWYNIRFLTVAQVSNGKFSKW